MTRPDHAPDAPAPPLRLAVACQVSESPRADRKAHRYGAGLTATRSGRALLAEMQAIPSLNREQERALALRIEEGQQRMLLALLRHAPTALEVRRLLGDAAAGRAAIDTVLDESPGDDLAHARLQRLVTELCEAQDADQAARAIASARIRRDALETLASGVTDHDIRTDVDKGRRIADEAKRELVRRHLWLVVSIASRHGARGLDLMDRVQEGCLGLMQAAHRFRVRKGFRFATYAAFWVRKAIHRAVAEQGHCVRLPTRTLEAAQKAERVQQRFLARTGQHGTQERVARCADMSVERLREVQRGVSDAVCTDEPEHTLVDTTRDPEQLVARAEEHRVLHTQIASLSAREKRVVTLRFGLDGNEEASRDEVAGVFSLTRERIRQIEKHAIERMQHPSRAASWS